MSKYLVETYYTCTFKILHQLNELNESELSKLEKRNDGKVEIIDAGDSDASKGDRLMARPFKMPKELSLKTTNVYKDFVEKIEDFSPIFQNPSAFK